MTASRNETNLVDAPATMSVVTAGQIAAPPGRGLRRGAADDAWDQRDRDGGRRHLRDESAGHGRRCAQTSSSSSTVGPSPSTSWGFTLWGFAPLDLEDAKQIELVQGPASAVWGANALTGVVNILSRSPREDLGTRLRLSGGLFGRDAGQLAGSGAGTTWSLGLNHARTFGAKWALRVNAGYSDSDAWPRPAGNVPEGTHPLDPGEPTGGAPYPPFQSRGTQQPRVSVRVDQELETGARLIYEAGFNQASGLSFADRPVLRDGRASAFSRHGTRRRACASVLSATS